MAEAALGGVAANLAVGRGDDCRPQICNAALPYFEETL